MNSKEYQALAESLDSNYPNVNDRLKDNRRLQQLIHASLGLSGEVGETVDIIKKHIIFDKPLDEEKLKNELGDVFYYLNIFLTVLNCSFEDIMETNAIKLRKRFPDGFSEKAALERKDTKC